MLGDPVELLSLLIEDAYPTIIVDRDKPRARALSDDFYVYVQETAAGTSPMPDNLDDVVLDVVVYSQGGRTVATSRAREIQHHIRDAWFNQQDLGQGYIKNFVTLTRPYVQQLAGIPASTTRVSATYSLSTRPPGQ